MKNSILDDSILNDIGKLKYCINESQTKAKDEDINRFIVLNKNFIIISADNILNDDKFNPDEEYCLISIEESAAIRSNIIASIVNRKTNSSRTILSTKYENYISTDNLYRILNFLSINYSLKINNVLPKYSNPESKTTYNNIAEYILGNYSINIDTKVHNIIKISDNEYHVLNIQTKTISCKIFVTDNAIFMNTRDFENDDRSDIVVYKINKYGNKDKVECNVSLKSTNFIDSSSLSMQINKDEDNIEGEEEIRHGYCDDDFEYNEDGILISKDKAMVISIDDDSYISIHKLYLDCFDIEANLSNLFVIEKVSKTILHSYDKLFSEIHMYEYERRVFTIDNQDLFDDLMLNREKYEESIRNMFK